MKSVFRTSTLSIVCRISLVSQSVNGKSQPSGFGLWTGTVLGSNSAACTFNYDEWAFIFLPWESSDSFASFFIYFSCLVWSRRKVLGDFLWNVLTGWLITWTWASWWDIHCSNSMFTYTEDPTWEIFHVLGEMFSPSGVNDEAKCFKELWKSIVGRYGITY